MVSIGLIAGLLVSCGSAKPFTPGTAEMPRTVTVSALDSLAFDPAHIQVQAGETIRFVVTNGGVLEHEFGIGTREALRAHAMVMTHGGMRQDTATTIRLIPGQTKELIYTFKSTDVGYGCMVAGHYPAGMSGDFEFVQ